MAQRSWIGGLLVAVSLCALGCDQRFVHPTSSMEPTIPKGSDVRADMGAYKHKGPARFELVVYVPPKNATQADVKYLGTVIGLPGEAVEVDKGGVKINGASIASPLKIPYRSYESREKSVISPTFQNVTLKADEYYILGDNTDNSFDCRFFGPIQKGAVLGRITSINGKALKP